MKEEEFANFDVPFHNASNFSANCNNSSNSNDSRQQQPQQQKTTTLSHLCFFFLLRQTTQSPSDCRTGRCERGDKKNTIKKSMWETQLPLPTSPPPQKKNYNTDLSVPGLLTIAGSTGPPPLPFLCRRIPGGGGGGGGLLGECRRKNPKPGEGVAASRLLLLFFPFLAAALAVCPQGASRFPGCRSWRSGRTSSAGTGRPTHTRGWGAVGWVGCHCV